MEPTSTDATREPSNGPAAKLPRKEDAAKPDPKMTPKAKPGPKMTPKAKPKKKGTKKAHEAPAATAKGPKAKVPKASGKKVKADPPTKPTQKKKEKATKERKRKAKDGEEGASPARKAKAKAKKAKSAASGGGASPRKKKAKKSSGRASKAASGDQPPSYLGVTRRGGQYEAAVQRGSREYNMGVYDVAADAAVAYDAAHRITAPHGSSWGGALANNDAEGIQRALHWLDGDAQDMSSPKSGAEGGVNFATPAEYRTARQLELQASGLEGGLDEEGLKLRIKKEILNLARAYVDNPPSPVQDPPVGHGSEHGSDAASASSQEGKGRKRKAASSLLKKKTWTPDPEENDIDEEQDEDVTAQAAALLGLKRTPGSDPKAEATYGDAKVAAAKARSGSIAETPAEKEKKKGALAKKLQAMMGGADASGASQTSAVGAVGAGAAVVIAEGHATAAPAAAPPSAPATAAAAATLSNPTLPPGTTEDPGLRTLLLLRQTQLDQERRAMVDLAAARLPSSSSGGDPALEQLLALAAQRPDLVNGGALQAAVQAREAAAPRPAPPAAPTVPVSTLPAGLVEHLATLQAPEEDPLQVIQKRLAKEEKRAVLAKKLEALMSGEGAESGVTPGTAAVVEPEATTGQKGDEGGEANSASASAAQLQPQQQQQLDALQALQGPARVPLGAKDEQEQQLQTLRMLQALSRDAPPTTASRANTEQEALLQSLAVKKQLAELNRAALEQKLQQYMQGGGSAAPAPTSAVSLPPSLQATNPSSTRTSLQALLEEQRVQNAQNTMAQEAVRRRAMVESLVLASEEDRLRRMREELHRQLASPQMGALGSPLLGAAAGSLGADLVRRALASSEAAASAAEHRAQVERRSQEMELQQALALRAATLEGQAERGSQEMELRQALALRAAVLEGQKRGSGL